MILKQSLGRSAALFALASALCAMPTIAQTAAPADEQSATTGIEDIVVTAQRRSENLQRAAVAVSALGGDALLNAGVTEPVALSRLIPSLVVHPTGLSTSFYIRGVGASSLNSFQENAVSFSVNGVFYARPTAPAGSFYDLERVEVVKGPQGTLYGRNATAGAINLIPKRPSLNGVSGDMTLDYGNYDAKKASAAINIPLGSSVAVRVAGQLIDRDGYLSDGYDDEKVQSVRGQLLFEPSSSFSMLISADYAHQGGKGQGSIVLPSPQTPTVPSADDYVGGSDPRITAILQARTLGLYSTIPPFSSLPTATIIGLVANPAGDGRQDSNFWGISNTITADLGFADLTVIGAYRDSKPDILTYAPGFPSRFQEHDKQWTGEARLSSKAGDRLGYVVGLFYFKETQDSYNNFRQGLLANTEYRPHLETESAAIFGQATYSVTDPLRIVGGIRYTKEDKSLSGDTRNSSLFIPNPPYVPVSGSLSFDRVTWKAGVEFDAGPRSLMYANVATGFKAGGFFPSAGQNTYRPETLTAYTLGSKNRFFDNKLQLNVEAFYWRYRDQQLTYVGPVESTPGNFAQAGVTVNAGRARMYGIEIEALFAPTPDDTFGINLQYLNARYQSLVYNAISSSGAPLLTACSVANDSRVATPPARLFIVDCSGKPGLNSPKWSLNLNYEHEFHLSGDINLTAGARSKIEASSYVSFDFLEFQKRESYTATDAYLTLGSRDHQWSLTGYINNIENKAVIGGGLTRPIINTSVFTVRPPRTFGARVTYKF